MRFPQILLLATSVALLSLSCGPKDYAVKGNTVTVKLQAPADGGAAQVRLQVLGEKIIRVSATPDKKFNDRNSLVVLPVTEKTPFSVTAEGGLVKVATAAMRIFFIEIVLCLIFTKIVIFPEKAPFSGLISARKTVFLTD